MAVFDQHDVRFEYPDDWELDEQTSGLQTDVTVTSPETCFWSLTLIHDRPDPSRVLETALDAYREEYPELDVYDSDASLGDEVSIAKDVDFVCHELVSSAFLRACRAERFTALVLFQGYNRELDESRAVLEAITASLRWVTD